MAIVRWLVALLILAGPGSTMIIFLLAVRLFPFPIYGRPPLWQAISAAIAMALWFQGSIYLVRMALAPCCKNI